MVNQSQQRLEIVRLDRVKAANASADDVTAGMFVFRRIYFYRLVVLARYMLLYSLLNLIMGPSSRHMRRQFHARGGNKKAFFVSFFLAI